MKQSLLRLVNAHTLLLADTLSEYNYMLKKFCLPAIAAGLAAMPVVGEEGGSGHYFPGSMASFVDGVPTEETVIVRLNALHYDGDFDSDVAVPIAGLVSPDSGMNRLRATAGPAPLLVILKLAPLVSDRWFPTVGSWVRTILLRSSNGCMSSVWNDAPRATRCFSRHW